jgi:hypothetical protein
VSITLPLEKTGNFLLFFTDSIPDAKQYNEGGTSSVWQGEAREGEEGGA